jgi:hypothetical protein
MSETNSGAPERKVRNMRIVRRALYWIFTVPYVLILTVFAIAIPYATIDFIRGGLPEVKRWQIHLRVEGMPTEWSHGPGYWTWSRILIPYLCYFAAGIALWAIRRFLRSKFTVPTSADIQIQGASPD